MKGLRFNGIARSLCKKGFWRHPFIWIKSPSMLFSSWGTSSDSSHYLLTETDTLIHVHVLHLVWITVTESKSDCLIKPQIDLSMETIHILEFVYSM